MRTFPIFVNDKMISALWDVLHCEELPILGEIVDSPDIYPAALSWALELMRGSRLWDKTGNAWRVLGVDEAETFRFVEFPAFSDDGGAQSIGLFLMDVFTQYLAARVMLDVGDKKTQDGVLLWIAALAGACVGRNIDENGRELPDILIGNRDETPETRWILCPDSIIPYAGAFFLVPSAAGELMIGLWEIWCTSWREIARHSSGAEYLDGRAASIGLVRHPSAAARA